MSAERLAWAYLSRVVEPPCREVAELVDAVGVVEAAARVRAGRLSESLAQRTAARRDVDSAAADLATAAALGGRLVTPDDDEWPYTAFTGLRVYTGARRAESVAPLALWVVGEESLADVTARAAALVGTRVATAYGTTTAAEFAEGLAEHDVTVVSGGAFGIDGAAHRAALAAAAPTVAVLAGGVDVPYPAGHADMLRRITRQGLVVSEYPPGLRPARHRFLVRNRLVAALSDATVVVEAGLRSGAANTAAWAEGMGRPVGAVPGPVTSSVSAGCHQLIRAGAVLVTRPAEVLELVGRIGELADEPERPASPLDDLTAEHRRILDALPARGRRTTSAVTVEAGLPVEQVLGGLAMLEVAQLVARDGDGWRLTRRPAATPRGAR